MCIVCAALMISEGAYHKKLSPCNFDLLKRYLYMGIVEKSTIIAILLIFHFMNTFMADAPRIFGIFQKIFNQKSDQKPTYIFVPNVC